MIFQMVAEKKERERLEEAARRRAEMENRLRKYREQEVRQLHGAYLPTGNLKFCPQK